MAVENLYLEKISEWVSTLIEQREGYFLIEVNILQGNQVKIFIDADNGASINELAKMSKALRRQIDTENLFPDGNFTLEVSSPGLDMPLKKRRQYKKNIGREVDLVLKDGRKVKGILKDVTEDTILLSYPPKKKKSKKKRETDNKEKAPEYFSFDKIKTTKVCIGF